MPFDIDSLSDLDVIIRTLDGEAANQGIDGMTGVGCVIQNRVNLCWQGETTARGVCLHVEQFDCWLPGEDFNRITASDYAPPEGCSDIAARVVAGALADVTGGADSYFDDSIQPPSWADPVKFTVKIGSLNFYRLA